MNVKKVNKSFIRHLLVAIGFIAAFEVSAQQYEVRGTVTDLKGEPIIGANVLVKGTTNGVITDIDGNYSISSVESSSVLV